MRLICPNCGAQYEVPDDVIPLSGRDVQCSNCGDTWFQKHPSLDRELAEELGQPLDDAHWQDEAAAETAPEAEPGPEPEPEPEPGPEPAEEQAGPGEEDAFSGDDEPPGEEAAGEDAWRDEDEGDDADEANTGTPEAPGWQQEPPEESGEWDSFDDEEEAHDEDEAPAAAAVPPRELDPEVRDVLREEAEREAQARAAESAGGLETQPDLGIDAAEDEATRREREARIRMAQMRGEQDETLLAAGAGLATQASRRDLLPDIDEINSTLRNDSERAAVAAPEDAEPARPERRGFSRGFTMMLLLFVVLVLIYVFAPQIAEAVPGTRGILESYVALVDKLRAMLDNLVLSLTGMLDGMSSEGSEAAGN